MPSDGEIYSRLSFDSDEQRRKFIASLHPLLPVHCAHCGMRDTEAVTTDCAPPFKVQPHLFSGNHPADREKPGEP